MNAKKSVLGKGLGALIEDADGGMQAAINEILISEIEANPFQPRENFDKDALDELAKSIKEIGIIQPITVRRTGVKKYQLIAGERRFRAAVIVGLKTIPAFIREANDQAMLEMALVENIQREDLDAIEVAISYQRLIEECELTQENLSDRVGKNRSTISNYLRLLKLPAEIQLGIRNRELSMGHARALVNIEDSEGQLEIYNTILSEQLSVRQTEELVRKGRPAPKPKKKDKPGLSEDYSKLKDQLSRYFSSDVDFKRNKLGRGSIVIPFHSDEDLERIIGLLDHLKK